MEVLLIVLLLSPAAVAVRLSAPRSGSSDLTVRTLGVMSAVITVGEIVFGSVQEGFGTFVLRPILETSPTGVDGIFSAGFASGAFWWQYAAIYWPACFAAAFGVRWLTRSTEGSREHAYLNAGRDSDD